MKDYVIEVFTTQNENGYFWCVIEISATGRSNAGCGRSETREKAFTDACAYYDRYINV